MWSECESVEESINWTLKVVRLSFVELQNPGTNYLLVHLRYKMEYERSFWCCHCSNLQCLDVLCTCLKAWKGPRQINRQQVHSSNPNNHVRASRPYHLIFVNEPPAKLSTWLRWVTQIKPSYKEQFLFMLTLLMQK